MNLNRMHWCTMLALAGGLLTLPVHADTLNVDLTSSLSGSPGDTLTFQGTLTNNSGGDLWINEVGINLAGFDPSNIDPTDFILNVAPLLADGTSTGSVDFFTVTIPDPFATGSYAGVLTVQGGATPNDDAVLGTANFEVDVNAAGTAAVAEPSSFPFIAMIILGIAVGRRFRHRWTVT